MDRLLLLTDENSSFLVWGMPMWLAWVVIGILLLFTGMFSACENAYSTCNKYHFKAEAEKGKRYAKIITRLVDKFDNTLVVILVTSNTLSTVMSFISAMLWLNVSIQYQWADGLEAVFSTLVMGFLFYVIADTIPKVISRAIPDQIAVLMAYPLFLLQILLFPITFVFKRLLNLIHHLLHLQDENLLNKEDFLFEANQAVNEDEISDDDAVEEKPEKLFEKDETEILNHVLSFDERNVSQVYVPLEKVYSIDIEGLTAEKINKIIQTTSFSRIPVYEGEKNNIIGILILRIYFEEYMKDPHLSIPSILEDVVKIPYDMKLDDALNELNSQKVHLGVVTKEGKITGIVTMEDILEEVVNNIDEETSLKSAKGALKHE